MPDFLYSKFKQKLFGAQVNSQSALLKLLRLQNQWRMTAIGTKLAYEFERRTAGFAVELTVRAACSTIRNKSKAGMIKKNLTVSLSSTFCQLFNRAL
jgi:hypothetical protein